MSMCYVCTLWALVCVLLNPGGVRGNITPEIWTKEMYPNPQVDLDSCGRRGYPSWVCDPNGVISHGEANKLDEVIEFMRENTGPCICNKKCPGNSPGYQGYQPAVALLNRMYFKKSNPSASQKRKAANDFSDYLRDDSWEFGACNDDLVIFVSKLDRQVYTAVGDNTRTILTDACVEQVYQEVKPMLAEGNFGLAIKNMLHEYTLALQHKHDCNKSQGKNIGQTAGIVVGAGLLGIFGIGFCVFRRHKSCASGSTSHTTGGSRPHTWNHSSHHTHRASISSHCSASSGGGGGGF